MRVAYYADDGTEFDTEEACRKYEKRLADLMYEHQHNGFYIYDDDGDEIDLSTYDLENLEDAFQDVSYIMFHSQKAIDVFAAQANDIGMCDIEEDIRRPVMVCERYFYDWDKDKWTCLEDRQRELDRIARIFE